MNPEEKTPPTLNAIRQLEDAMGKFYTLREKAELINMAMSGYMPLANNIIFPLNPEKLETIRCCYAEFNTALFAATVELEKATNDAVKELFTVMKPRAIKTDEEKLTEGIAAAMDKQPG